ncbi:MAG: hypothetical protein AAF532_17265 [Planctomycetota bacterium]
MIEFHWRLLVLMTVVVVGCGCVAPARAQAPTRPKVYYLKPPASEDARNYDAAVNCDPAVASLFRHYDIETVFADSERGRYLAARHDVRSFPAWVAPGARRVVVRFLTVREFLQRFHDTFRVLLTGRTAAESVVDTRRSDDAYARLAAVETSQAVLSGRVVALEAQIEAVITRVTALAETPGTNPKVAAELNRLAVDLGEVRKAKAAPDLSGYARLDAIKGLATAAGLEELSGKVTVAQAALGTLDEIRDQARDAKHTALGAAWGHAGVLGVLVVAFWYLQPVSKVRGWLRDHEAADRVAAGETPPIAPPPAAAPVAATKSGATLNRRR